MNAIRTSITASNTVVMRVSNTTMTSTEMIGNVSPSNSKITATPTNNFSTTKVSNTILTRLKTRSTTFTDIALPSYYLDSTVSTTGNFLETMAISQTSMTSPKKTSIKLSSYSNFTITLSSNFLKTMIASNTSMSSLEMTVITPSSEKSTTSTIPTALTSSLMTAVVHPSYSSSTAPITVNMSTTSLTSTMTPNTSPISKNVTTTQTSNLLVTLDSRPNYTTIAIHNTSVTMTAIIISPSHSNITVTRTNLVTMSPRNTILTSRNSVLPSHNTTNSASLSHLNITATMTLPTVSFANTKLILATLSTYPNTSMQSRSSTKNVTSLSLFKMTVISDSSATTPEKTMETPSITMTATIMSSGSSSIVESLTSLPVTTQQLVRSNISSTKLSPTSTVIEPSLIVVNASSSQRLSSIILAITSEGIPVSNISSTKSHLSSTVLQSYLVATSRNGSNIPSQTSSMFTVSSKRTSMSKISSLIVSPSSPMITDGINASQQASSAILTSASASMIYSTELLPSSTVVQSHVVTIYKNASLAFSPLPTSPILTATLKEGSVFNTTSTELLTSMSHMMTIQPVSANQVSTSGIGSSLFTSKGYLVSNLISSTELLIRSTASHTTRISSSQVSTPGMSSSLFTSKRYLVSNLISSSTVLLIRSTASHTTRISSSPRKVSTLGIRSSLFTSKGYLVSNLISSTELLIRSTASHTTRISSSPRKVSSLVLSSSLITSKGYLVSNLISSPTELLIPSTASHTTRISSSPRKVSTSGMSSSLFTSKGYLVSNLISSSTELLIRSTASHTTRISSSPRKVSTLGISSSLFTSKGYLVSNLISSSTELLVRSTASHTTRISSSPRKVSSLVLSSSLITSNGYLVSNLISSSTELLILSSPPHTTRLSSSPSQVSTSGISSSLFSSKGYHVSDLVSSTELVISSPTLYNTRINSSPRKVSSLRLSSAPMKITTKATTLSKIPSSLYIVVSSGSVSCRSCTDVLETSTVPSVAFSSSSVATTVVSEEFKVQVTLLIPLNVEFHETFRETLRRNLQSLFDIGTAKIASSRKRRAIGNLRQLLNKELGASVEVVSGRFRRQTTNRTSVEIVNITRTPESENVQVTFYVSRGNSLVPAKEAATIMNAPTTAEKVAALKYSVSGEFSAVTLQEGTTKKKNYETLLIVLAVCLPVAFVLIACLFIKCKKKEKSSRKMKLNKVSIEKPAPREKASVPESAIEERYTRMATLPRKDYPDVIIQTPSRRKQRTKKAKLPLVLDSERENPPAATPPAGAFENITRMSFEGPSNVTIDDIPLRLRPAVRQEMELQAPSSKDIVEESGVPRSWIEDKQRVEMKSKDSYNKDERKMVADASNGDTPRDMEEIDYVGSDDTMQIKANIEKWRNKMRQREKRKQRKEERKLAEQDKLIALEQKKLSRREWLMAQPEIQAILDGEDLPTSSSLGRRKKYRRERWRESRNHLDSESDNEVMVVPMKRHHRRRWPDRSTRRVGPSEHDGVRLIAVRPKKPRVYAFEEPAAEQEFEPRYISAEVGSVPPPAVAEDMQLREEYNDSPESVYDEEFFDPFVPEYDEPRYYPQPRREYVIRQTPVTLERQLPLRMQETSFDGTPRRARPRVLRQFDTRHGAMFYERQPPRPSNLYSRAKKSPNGAKNDITREETNDGNTSSKNTPQVESPSENTTPRGTTDTAHSQNSGKRMVTSNQNEISPVRSWETDAELRNYNINESEARKLVSCVLDRAAKNEAD